MSRLKFPLPEESASEVTIALTAPDHEARFGELLNEAQTPDFDPNRANSAGFTPLQSAIMNGDVDHVTKMVARGAIPTEEDIELAMRYPHKTGLVAELRAVALSHQSRVGAAAALSDVATGKIKPLA